MGSIGKIAVPRVGMTGDASVVPADSAADSTIHTPPVPVTLERMNVLPGRLWQAAKKNPDAKTDAQKSDRIIPLDKLDAVLSDRKLEKKLRDPEFASKLRYNLSFYYDWYPSETGEVFARARATMTAHKIIPCAAYMKFEYNYAPNFDQAVGWIETRATEWLNQQKKVTDMRGEIAVVDSQVTLLSGVIDLSILWFDELSDGDKERLKNALLPTYEFLFQKHLMGSDEDIFFYSNAVDYFSVITNSFVTKQHALLDENYFEGEPKDVFKKMGYDGDNLSYEYLQPSDQKRLWDFFTKQYSVLYVYHDYWHLLDNFLSSYPDYTDAFFQVHPLWTSQKLPEVKHGDSMEQASPTDVTWLYEDIVCFGHEWVNDEQRQIAYRTLFELGDLDLAPDEVPLFKEATTIDKTKTVFITLFLAHKISAHKTDDATPTVDLIGGKLFSAQLKEQTPEKIIAFLHEHFPAEASRFVMTEKILQMRGEHSDEATAFFLREMQVQTLSTQQLAADPLWAFVCCEENNWSFSEFEKHNPTEQYELFLKNLPQHLIDHGKIELVRKFFDATHPYADIYQLPPDLRPTGNGFAFASLDSFPDPSKMAHPDKAKVVFASAPHYETEESGSHGYGTTTVAVGDTYGLAPGAALYEIPVLTDSRTSLIELVCQGLEELIELKKKDPTLKVAGMSLAADVPYEFEAMARQSPLFTRMETLCKQLYDSGVVLVVSSGNDGGLDHENILTYFDGVVSVGAVDSNDTVTFIDDKHSEYSTGSDRPEVAVTFYAQADPTLYYDRPDVPPKWLNDAGTSFAQPYVSGSYLLLWSVNPSLTLQQARDLLTITQGKVQINPMLALVMSAHLPQSTYSGERLEEFTQCLTGMTSDEFVAKYQSDLDKIVRE